MNAAKMNRWTFCADCGICKRSCPNGIQIVSRLQETVNTLENHFV